MVSACLGESGRELDAVAADLCRYLVDRRSKDCDRPAARRAVARDLTFSPARVERFERRRVKKVGADDLRRLADAAVREIEREIAGLEHARALALAARGARGPALAEIETHLAAARRLLEESG